jgi:hypothetical protein
MQSAQTVLGAQCTFWTCRSHYRASRSPNGVAVPSCRTHSPTDTPASRLYKEETMQSALGLWDPIHPLDMSQSVPDIPTTMSSSSVLSNPQPQGHTCKQNLERGDHAIGLGTQSTLWTCRSHYRTSPHGELQFGPVEPTASASMAHLQAGPR